MLGLTGCCTPRCCPRPAYCALSACASSTLRSYGYYATAALNAADSWWVGSASAAIIRTPAAETAGNEAHDDVEMRSGTVTSMRESKHVLHWDTCEVLADMEVWVFIWVDVCAAAWDTWMPA